jgi:NitT/TauT family transport system permease protein
MPPDAAAGTPPATSVPQASSASSAPSAQSDEAFASLERGLDVLTVERVQRRVWWRVVLGKAVPPLLAAGLVLLAWQIVFWAKIKPDYVIPSPAMVWTTVTDLWQQGALQRAVRTSVSRGLLGFALSVAVGTPLGLLVARVRLLRAALRPILSGLQSLPSVAWVPFGIILFGLSPATIYTVVLLGAVPSIATGMIAGIDQIPPLYHRVGRVLGARGLVAARHIVLPAAMPGYVAGLKQGWAFSWRSLMAAELITQSARLGTGVGQLLDAGREALDPTIVFGMIIVILLVGVAIDQLIFAPLERSVLRRRGLAGT